MATGGGAVWVADVSGKVHRIDPAAGATRGKPVEIGGLPLALAVGDDSVWVVDGQRLVRIRL